MRHLFRLIIIIHCVTGSGCTTDTPLKAPCNYYATFCGQKIKINAVE